MKSLYTFAAAAFGLLAAPGISHAAVNCTITGKMQVEPQDRYYCDSTHQNCFGWNQVDLDTKLGAAQAAPLRYMRVTIRNTAGTLLTTTTTNASGNFSATVSMPGAACANQVVRVQREFVRIHESDGALPSPRSRFRIINNLPARQTQAEYRNLTLTGNTSDGSFRQLASDTTSNSSHWANVYYTMDAALAEIINWNGTLNTRLTYPNVTAAQAVIVDSTLTGKSSCRSSAGQDGTISLNFASYATGGEIRHELGHWVQAALHAFGQHNWCIDYSYDGDTATANHGMNSCEFGYASNKEALATFIGVRSITTSDMNAWWCQMGSTSTTRDQCSLDIKNRTGDGDRDGINVLTGWAILGDDFATNIDGCAILTTNCKCDNPAAGEPPCTQQAFRNNNGFRNEIQPGRLYWDILDTNNEGTDDVDISMGDFVLAMFGMPSGTANGRYNEAGTSAAACFPDQANVRDYANAVDTWLATNMPGRTTAAERTLNCVSAGAP